MHVARRGPTCRSRSSLSPGSRAPHPGYAVAMSDAPKSALELALERLKKKDSESGVEPNTVVLFDPATEKFQTWPIPSGGGVVRNVSVTKDGNLAMALSGVNKVGLVEIRK